MALAAISIGEKLLTDVVLDAVEYCGS